MKKNKLIARHKNSHYLFFDTELAENYLSSSVVKRWFLRNLRGEYKIFSPLFTKTDLIEAVKNEMKEYSNPTFIIAKGLDIKPKELDELKKKVIAEETNSKDYVALKSLLERLLKQ